MITIAKGIKKEDVLTLEDMDCGDSFVILVPDWDEVYLMCDNDTFVEISTGETYDVRDYKHFPVCEFDFTLVEK